jgi:hypothetical protein
MSDLAKQHTERHRDQASRAFAKHAITKQSEGRWLLQSRYDDGVIDWTMTAEVIVLAGTGQLYVGGDIDHVVFAHGPADPIARVRWMGECKDLGYYVRQKARIGQARNQHVIDVWKEEIAHQELREYLASVEEDEPGFAESGSFDRDYFEMALGQDDRREFQDYAAKAFKGDRDIWESVGSMGEVLSPHVIYAHAALARLCVLLRETEAAVEKVVSASLVSCPWVGV